MRSIPNVSDSPSFRAFENLNNNSAFQQIQKHIERCDRLTKPFHDPLRGLVNSDVFDRAINLQPNFEQTLNIIERSNNVFALPEIERISVLAEEFSKHPLAINMERYALQAETFISAMKAMETPWLDAINTTQSFDSFVRVQGIGNILDLAPSFDETVCAALRVDLGDWRDSVDWEEELPKTLETREEFYQDLGYDTSLVDLPADAFDECTQIAGLRQTPPSVIDIYGDPILHTDSAKDEDAYCRTNIAHDWLLRLETNLRKFIDEQMTLAFGPDWAKRQLPNGLYESWMSKKETAIKYGRCPMPLIAYADFRDYELVICRNDNWKNAFSKYFARKENIRESFQRLYPIRLDTMHARPIGLDDELLLYVETKRIVKAIKLIGF